MKAVIHPHPLAGSIEIPCSKSYAHRLLIAAALCESPTHIRMNALNSDIIATTQCLCALGAKIERTDDGYTVFPIAQNRPDNAVLFCGESGSTLRFLIPVAAALGIRCTFTGAGRLPSRPNAVLIDALNAHGANADRDLLPMHMDGKLRGGTYRIAGNVSSQYITGLLLALPLCEQDSDIQLTTHLESAAYVDITLETLAPFGIRIERTHEGWHIPGGQQYRSPKELSAQGDWSSAAFWIAANALGSKVECRGLHPASVQGDRAIVDMLSRLGGEIDVSNTPDLVPALAVAAAAHVGTTRIVGAARLRIKESDRLRSVRGMLESLGGRVDELEDGLVIYGGQPLHGGTVDGCNDHRIVMAAAIAATVADGSVTILDAQAVDKSYPQFFESYRALGGLANVESNR